MNLPEGKENKEKPHNDPAKEIETVTPENENLEPVPDEDEGKVSEEEKR